MVSPGPVVAPRLDAVPRSAAQTRILDAALDLIGEHGVSGTSLQMIANSVGVTKAAVYHKFKSKDEIVIAVTERELAKLQDALDAAEAEKQHSRATLVVARRRHRHGRGAAPMGEHTAARSRDRSVARRTSTVPGFPQSAVRRTARRGCRCRRARVLAAILRRLSPAR